MSNAITILIADDNEVMRETLRFLLSRIDHFKILGEATSGVETIELAATLSPNIVLLDINMAPVNGFEAARKIIQQNPAVRIIGLSIHKEPSYALNIMQIGASGYLTKSSSPKEIIHAIHEVSEGRQYICEEISQQLP